MGNYTKSINEKERESGENGQLYKRRGVAVWVRLMIKQQKRDVCCLDLILER
jgi:hypothetical protein